MKTFGVHWLRILVIVEFLIVIMLFVPGASLTTWAGPQLGEYGRNPNPETKRIADEAVQKYQNRLHNWKIFWAGVLIANTVGIVLLQNRATKAKQFVKI